MNIREELADLEHQQWAHWTRYMLNNLTPENIKRWLRQVDTPYTSLLEKEKESDRRWADKVLKIIAQNSSKTLEFTDQIQQNDENDLSIDPDLADEIRWDKSFSCSSDILAKLGAVAMIEYCAGKTQEFNPDTEYLSSIPGMVQSIQEGLTIPIKDCAKNLE